MNTMYIIGNGFDLAHGLKTSYSDFLIWYLKECLEELDRRETYEDCLLKLEGSLIHNSWRSISSISNYYKILEFNSIKSYPKGEFGYNILKENINNWVDLESEYYSCLLAILKRYEPISIRDRGKSEIEELNIQFAFIKAQLENYLKQLDKNILVHKEIQNHFCQDELSSFNTDKHLVLNFNYTTSVEHYIYHIPEIKCINIHGQLCDYKNPIIFGYGDEMHHDYESLERLNDDQYLINFKSFGYLRNSNYKQFESFLDDDEFRVKILGHSCGLSDRLLLSTVFQHRKCKRIEICYYKKSDKENDHYEKTIRISRHFSPTFKADMRRKIQPLDLAVPLRPPE